MLLFTKIILTSAKLRKSWYQKIYFLKFHICVYLCVKLKVSNIILTSSRGGSVYFYPFSSPTAKWTSQKSTQPRIKIYLYGGSVTEHCFVSYFNSTKKEVDSRAKYEEINGKSILNRIDTIYRYYSYYSYGIDTIAFSPT